MQHDWCAPKFSIIRPSKPVRDFVSWTLAAPIVTQRSKDSLEPIIGEFVEFLPFATIRSKILYAVNVIKLIDCLDLERSELTYVPEEPGRVIFASKYVFNKEKVRSVPIFKVPQSLHIFVSDVFADVVVNAKLTGAGFDDPENILWVKKPWNRTMEDLPLVKEFH